MENLLSTELSAHPCPSSSESGGSDYGGTYKSDILDPVRPDDEFCIRCHKKVYVTEMEEVGVPLHKNCLRCVECNATLTLNTCIIARSELAGSKAVYCRTHAPKPVKYAMDQHDFGLKNAVLAQRLSHKQSFNTQVNNSRSLLVILC